MTHCDVACTRCGNIAATFTARAAGATGDKVLGDRDCVVRTGWQGELTFPLPWENAMVLLAKLREGRLVELQQADFDTYGFFCRQCAKAYCSTCWKIGPPQFDEGFYDCTYGWCPLGHRQIVDD